MTEQFDLKEILRFLVGGGSAVITDFIGYHVMCGLGLDVNLSKAISYVMGAAVGFVINKLWTFQSKRFRMSEIVIYILLYAFSAGINTLVNHIFLNLTGIKLVAFLIATGFSTVINFIGQKFIVFRRRGEDK